MAWVCPWLIALEGEYALYGGMHATIWGLILCTLHKIDPYSVRVNFLVKYLHANLVEMTRDSLSMVCQAGIAESLLT